MGKKKAAAAAGLGRALIRDRSQPRGGGGGRRAGWVRSSAEEICTAGRGFSGRGRFGLCGEASLPALKQNNSDGFAECLYPLDFLFQQLHTSELNDGYDWSRLNVQSITEQSSLEDFLATAELAGTEFVAEKLNIRLVPAEARTGLLTAKETEEVHELHEQNKQFLRIPRRPYWDKQTSPELLDQAERESFLEWRRQLACLEEEQKLILTPFERNLEFWRQLWRVLERSDVVVQIVDARNPLLFRCPDLECYVKELGPEKETLLLLNKADFLSEGQRAAWARYFEGQGVKVVFWSALAEGRRLELASKAAEFLGRNAEHASQKEQQPSPERPSSPSLWSPGRGEQESSTDEDSEEYQDCEEEAWLTCSEEEEEEVAAESQTPVGSYQEKRTSCAEALGPGIQPSRSLQNSSRLVQRDELLEIFRTVHTGKKVKEGEVTVGLVGYPNVGKSSTINTILGRKKVSVSATPGHTKHFQTLYVEAGLCLCDCPGLVLPSFVATKAEMVCSGILPVDQMRDHLPPVSLVCQRIPRHVLEATYSINIVRPREDEEAHRPPTSEELLTAYGCMRGFMTDHGQPDQPRSARYVLKDYVAGKLLYCHPPPGAVPESFQLHPRRGAAGKGGHPSAETPAGWNPKAKQIDNPVDRAFFGQETVRALVRGGHSPAAPPAEASHGKPWKKHGNRNKKEKIRRLTKHLEA
ncbi:large subunit GTPase 1 homolog [Heteronotia binoei]|uniref:large subunit GTPase 1 homolog n=1 Tax=Heteronotia binoei TaxID=13085 RepID=UPI002930EE29|nr:large subunit GTPase 1 homolog [Heteronotia binoei]